LILDHGREEFIAERSGKDMRLSQGRLIVGGEASTKSSLESGMSGNEAECTGVRLGLQ
jgi:chromosome condensin MukBEF MukE localization factor